MPTNQNGDVGRLVQWIVNFITGIINGLYQLTVTIGFPSYALAIIMISIVIKLVLYPLTVKQMKSTQGMQEVQPKMAEIQKKYKNNPEKMNQEVMKLYQEYEINPMAGCLPLLIQLPILYGLFTALRQFPYTNVEHAGFLWISNISNSDPLYILPVIVGVTMFLQQKFMMPQTNSGGNEQMNQMMKTMLYVMPVMIGFMSLSFPAGLCIYWACFSVLSIIQQYFLNKARKKEMAVRAEKEAERRAEMERQKEEQRKMGQAPSKRKKKPAPKPKAEYIPPAKKAEENVKDKE